MRRRHPYYSLFRPCEEHPGSTEKTDYLIVPQRDTGPYDLPVGIAGTTQKLIQAATVFPRMPPDRRPDRKRRSLIRFPENIHVLS